MEIREINGNTVLEKTEDFNLKHIFDCGQCFRFVQTGENEYTGVAGNKALTVCETGNSIVLYDTSIDEFNDFWNSYFDLGNDYGAIKRSLSGEACMNRAIEEGSGIRILNQELFETIISFIISQSNNIPRIRKIIESLCAICGNEINYRNQVFYSFPTPEAILNTDISPIKAGFRDKYIINAAKHISENPDFIEELKNSDSASAKKLLMSLTGIGNKVSDCILLFGLNKTDSFPVDVWMHRIMEQLYFGKKCSIPEISAYAAEKFGNYSGYAQQYLFYYALNHKSEFKEDF